MYVYVGSYLAKRNPKRLRSIIHFGVDDVIRYSRLLAHLFSSSLVIRSPLIFRLASLKTKINIARMEENRKEKNSAHLLHLP